jgi:hypothetical protein
MPRGTTLVDLPQPTQSVQSKIYSIPLLTVTGGIRPSLTIIGPWSGGPWSGRLKTDRLTKDHLTTRPIHLFARSSWVGSAQAWMLAFTFPSSL